MQGKNAFKGKSEGFPFIVWEVLLNHMYSVCKATLRTHDSANLQILIDKKSNSLPLLETYNRLNRMLLVVGLN